MPESIYERVLLISCFGDHRSVHVAIPARLQNLVKFSTNYSNHRKPQPSRLLLLCLRTYKVSQPIRHRCCQSCARGNIVTVCVYRKPIDYTRTKIAGMAVAESPHNKYHGSAVFVRKDIKVNSIYVYKQGTVELITIEMPGVVVHSVYKPPTEPFVLPALEHSNLLHHVISDFNSHNTT